MLTPELVQEFKTIIQEEYGVDLLDNDAIEIATNMAGFFDQLAKIHHRDQTSAETPDLVLTSGLDQGF